MPPPLNDFLTQPRKESEDSQGQGGLPSGVDVQRMEKTIKELIQTS